MKNPRCFIDRLDQVVSELVDHPAIRVTCYAVAEPARSAALRRLAEHLGWAPDPALLDLYSAADGVQLRWHVRWPGDPRPLRSAPCPVPAPIDAIDLLDEDGVINIVPIDELLDRPRGALRPWVRPGPVRVAGLELPAEEFHDALRPFDAFSGYGQTGLVDLDAVGERCLVTSYDYGAQIPADAARTVPEYLEHLLVTRGLMIARTGSYCLARGIALPRLPRRWVRDHLLLTALADAAREGW